MFLWAEYTREAGSIFSQKISFLGCSPPGSLVRDRMRLFHAFILAWVCNTANRATLYGALLDLVSRARGDDASDMLTLWKRRGKRAFDAEAGDASPALPGDA